MRNQYSRHVTPVVGIFLVPSNGSLQAFFKRSLWGPSKTSNLVIINPVSLVVDGTVTDVLNHSIGILQVRAHQLEQRVRHLLVGDFKLGADIVSFTNNTLVHDCVKSFSNILTENEAALIGPIPVQAALFPLADQVDKLGNKFLGILVGAKRVVTARDDERHLERVIV